MTVAGGMSSRGWDLPIYVTNVDPDGVVGQEGSIRKGRTNVESLNRVIVWILFIIYSSEMFSNNDSLALYYFDML